MASTTAAAAAGYISDHDSIVAVMDLYGEGVRTGSSAVMKPAFHDACTFFGYSEGNLLAGPIQILFDWVDGNGPSPSFRTRLGRVEILGSVASVRLELDNMTGKLAGPQGARLSDLFQLIKIDGQWRISQKSFHWHAA